MVIKKKSIWWFTEYRLQQITGGETTSPIDRYCGSAITFNRHKRAAKTNQSTFFTCCFCTSAHKGDWYCRVVGGGGVTPTVIHQCDWKFVFCPAANYSIWTCQFFCFVQFLVAEGTMLLGYSIFQQFMTHSQMNLKSIQFNSTNPILWFRPDGLKTMFVFVSTTSTVSRPSCMFWF